MNPATIDVIKSAMKLDRTIKPALRIAVLQLLVSGKPASGEPVADTPDRYLAPKDAAQYLGLSKRTLARYVKGGQVTPSRLNARVLRFKKSTLDAFLTGENGDVE